MWITFPLVLAALCAGALWWWRACCVDNSIPFLPAAGSAHWIVYPAPPNTTPHHVVPFTADFRTAWLMDSVPANTSLSLRAFRQASVRINGHDLHELAADGRDWKKTQRFTIANYLRAGTNEITVAVTNSFGPPALWLEIDAAGKFLTTDTNWTVSLAGAASQKAALATAVPEVRPGNYLFGRETVGDSIRRSWLTAGAILLLAAMAVGGALYGLRRKEALRWPAWCRVDNAPIVLLVVILAAWAVLFLNNIPQIAHLLGFDRDGHLEYIDYIIKKGALPLASDGWQMYQPPLYYTLSALIVGPTAGTASSDGAVLALRFLSMFIGMGLVFAAFLCLRQLFPKEPLLQSVGLTFAGFLPANVCLSHHITNEVLSALFFTFSLYFTLRFVRQENRVARLCLAAGACLGLSLLTKFSTVLAVPFIVGAVAWAAGRKSGAGAAVHFTGLLLAAMIAVCGWHFARVWIRYGNPLIGNWDPRLPFAWWQDPGYHTANWYLNFGEALKSPLFSSISGFADGLYTTLWGDGLCSGSAVMNFRPQWNYDLLNWAYLLALPATVLIIVGGVVLLLRLLRRPDPETLLVLGLVSAFAAGVALMSLRVPSYAQVKAFYGLPALVPLVALAVAGWNFIASRAPRIRPVFAVWLLAWAMTVFGAFWIRSTSPFTHTVRGVGFANDSRYLDAVGEFSVAVTLDPKSLPGQIGLASALNNAGQRPEAQKVAAALLAENPRNGEALIEFATIAAVNQRHAEALQPLLAGLELEPDYLIGYQQLAGLYAKLGQHRNVAAACEAGLRVDPFDASLHQQLGVALGAAGDLTNAISQLRLALEINPNWPKARAALALALASTGQLDEATVQYGKAVEGKPDDNGIRKQYAVTLVMRGDFRNGVEQYYQYLASQPDDVEVLNNLAWILATSSDNSLRNGAEAVRLARRACDLTKEKEPVLLGTLAAAYAEAGKFREAEGAAEKARTLAIAAGQPDVAARNRELLDLYRSGKAFREPAPKQP
jgi:Flp pilus assembly protein TadD/4-amino-4-deoxy-L-arabinose transferase-like glycosyltransferase